MFLLRVYHYRDPFVHFVITAKPESELVSVSTNQTPKILKLKP